MFLSIQSSTAISIFFLRSFTECVHTKQISGQQGLNPGPHSRLFLPLDHHRLNVLKRHVNRCFRMLPNKQVSFCSKIKSNGGENKDLPASALFQKCQMQHKFYPLGRKCKFFEISKKNWSDVGRPSPTIWKTTSRRRRTWCSTRTWMSRLKWCWPAIETRVVEQSTTDPKDSGSNPRSGSFASSSTPKMTGG